MSLEQALAANTAAIQAQTTAMEDYLSYALRILEGLRQNLRPTADRYVDNHTATPSNRPEADAPAAQSAAVAPSVTAMIAQQAAEKEVSPESGQPAPDIKALSAAVTSAATRNRDGLVALLAKYEVKRASEVPETQWAQLISELEAL